MLSNAGANASDSKIGVKGMSKITPTAIIIVVIIDELAIAIVEITSPSSVECFTCAASLLNLSNYH